MLLLLLARGLLLGDRGAARPLAGARVGVRALAAHGEAAAVAQAAVAADVHQTLDVHLDALAQVALDIALTLDDRADAPQLILVEIAHARVERDLRLAQDRRGARAPDAENVRQSDLDALVNRKIDANYTSHLISPRLPMITPAAACASGSCRSRA